MAKTDYDNDLTFDEKVLMAVVRAAENFKRTHSNIFRKHGLSFPQYNILRVLESSKNGRNKISAVGKIMLVPGANMTGLAKRLEKKGFIMRKRDANDERAILLSITQKGRDTLKLIEDKKNACIETILKDLCQKDKEDILKKMKTIIKSIEITRREIQD